MKPPLKRILLLWLFIWTGIQAPAQSIRELHARAVYCFDSLQRYDSCIYYATQILKLDTLNDLAYYMRAFAQVNTNAWEAAMSDVQKAIELNSSVGDYFDIRGFIYDQNKKYELAIQDYNEAIRLLPKFARAYYHRGTTISNQFKNYAKAIGDYSTSISYDSTNAYAFYNRGIAYKKLKHYSNALKDYTYCIKLEPHYVPAYYNRALVYEAMNKPQKAIADYNAALQIDPSDIETLFNCGILLMNFSKNYTAAIRLYDRVIKIDSLWKNVYCLRALAKSQLNDFAGALADMRIEMMHQPDDATLMSKKGFILNRKGDFAEAIACYTYSISRVPKAAYYYQRARNYNLMGNTLLARQDYQKAIQLDPLIKNDVPPPYR